MEAVFQIAVLIMSVVVHEVSHGLAAQALGDPTARLSGRLSLNPLLHLDIFGSFLVPLFLFITNAGFVFGWAKPVPVNPYNLRGKYGEALVAAAGPLANLGIALAVGLLIRFLGSVLPDSFLHIAALVVLINIVLAVFNLVPLPPLDGSKILFGFFPLHLAEARAFLERYGFLFVIIFIVFFFEFLSPVIASLFSLFTGLAF